MEPNSWTIEYVTENMEACRKALEDPGMRSKVAYLNNLTSNCALPNHSLVRFRGMIQDMLDPEFYLEKYAVKGGSGSRLQDGRYRDTIVYQNEDESLNFDAKENVHGERRSLFIQTVPGLNSWVSETEQRLFHTPSSSPSGSSSSDSSRKRPISDVEDMDMDCDIQVSFDPTDPDPVKRVKPTPPADSPPTAPPPTNTNGLSSIRMSVFNSAIPSRPSKTCLVKIYEDFEKHKLNSVVDVIGFLAMDPVLDGSQDNFSDFPGFDADEHISCNPPPSVVPRIHAFSVHPISHVNPLLNGEENVVGQEETDICKDLVKVFTECLFGDEVAAQYLFCHLMSSIYARIDVENLGRCCLNLSNLPVGITSEYIRSVYEIVEMLVPASHYFPLTLENLNTTQFNPKKDFKTNRIQSGLLQLAPHTHLVIDETRLEAGQLQTPGLAALASIRQLIQNQIVKCDFQFYQLDFEADIPILCFSEGKSLLPSDFHCPLIPAEAESVRLISHTLGAAKQFVRSKAEEMRRFLTAKKSQSFSISESMQTVIQNDLVELRRNHQLKSDDFHMFLNLIRLVGKSLGKQAADAECWELVKSLELKRRSRIEALAKRNQNIES